MHLDGIMISNSKAFDGSAAYVCMHVCMHDLGSSMQDPQRPTRPTVTWPVPPKEAVLATHWVVDKQVHTPPSCFQALDACNHVKNT